MNDPKQSRRADGSIRCPHFNSPLLLEKIDQRRQALGWTWEETARHLGVARSTLRGLARPHFPRSAGVMMALTYFAQCSSDMFVTWHDEKQNPRRKRTSAAA